MPTPVQAALEGLFEADGLEGFLTWDRASAYEFTGLPEPSTPASTGSTQSGWVQAMTYD